MSITAALPKGSTVNLMKRLVKIYLKPYVPPLAVAVLFMIVAAAMTAALALLMEPILDGILSGEETHSIMLIAGMVLFVFVTRGISTYVHTIMTNKIGQSVSADIQKDLFRHFMALDLAFFHDNPSGSLISRVVNDVNVVRLAISDSLTGLGKSVITLVFLVGVMFYQDWRLSLAAFVVFPFASIFVAYIGKRLRRISESIQEKMASLSDRLSQVFHGIRQVKAYGTEDFEISRAGRAIDNVKKLNIKSAQIGNMSTPVNEIMVGFVFFGIIIYGGHQAAAGQITSGQMASFLGAFIMAYEPMKKLAKLNNSIQIGLGAAQRIFDMIDMEPSIRDKEGAVALDTKKPDIIFNIVNFKYEKSDVKALDNVSFSAQPGKVTALVGPSGGGKTTIINLIPRFYDVTSGSIIIDGYEIKDLSIASLRSQIALVSQDITIFDDSVGANIAYGSSGASQKDIKKAARAAAADGFISEFPDGYRTRVGEDGVKLSGGQRQRIAIARAILRDAPILLLDEATSALDNESEKAVQEALAVLEKGRTTIVIAHRLSTVRSADQIIVLDHGRIAEQGTHDELKEADGLYAKMYKTGLRE